MSIDVRVKQGFYWNMYLIGLLSLGSYFVIVLIFVLPHYPVRLDDDGIELRSGKRVRWAALSRVQRTTVLVAGQRVTGTLELWFGREKVIIAPTHIDPAREIVEFVHARTGAMPG